MKMYGGMEIKLHAFLKSALHIPVALLPGKEPSIPMREGGR
jgi:hypothetical protein